MVDTIQATTDSKEKGGVKGGWVVDWGAGCGDGMHSGVGWGNMMDSILDVLVMGGWSMEHLGE